MKIVLVAFVAFGAFAAARFPTLEVAPARPHSAAIRTIDDPSWQDAGALMLLATGLFGAAIRVKQRMPARSNPATSAPARG